ncbi:malate dehydrogenase (oxaloacetate-decarboxylating) [Caldanaerovirga acetigignens]|uniref:Malate dehydrogenase (Oxaloacetate-decarboxylating) n=1 Tax=Caldanaerovirga acetigignens TaxID=447595 RepID=A0A1M7G1H3_9FIRM|nr:malic enzyme-like NAD(P)-binding protein [Caldanaerovirga acetigignens]SHM10005.1 malate dehydrogenase (oxaloacetate-decarboxylating) [Caldanaerovirga acetigignens]
MDIREEALKLHRENKGKLEVISKVVVNNSTDLSLSYTPGVAEPCKEIMANPELAYEYTVKGHMVAVVTDGSAVLGLGNIGGLAGAPVMEGKCVLFKIFGGVDAFPICLNTQDVDEIVKTVKNISPIFGGINLEDIAAPRCFEVEKRLIKELDIPVFHDDQHGTAVVVLAAIMNALKLVDKQIENVTAIINGAGAAGIATAKLLLSAGIGNIILCDRKGTIYKGREGNDWSKEEIAEYTNKDLVKGTLADAIKGADIFIGVSGPGVLNKEMVASMSKNAIVLALANPVPEIWPEEAKAGGAKVVGTGRSDFPNQVNNVLAFPGIFRGALEVRANKINEEMKVAAAKAIAALAEENLDYDYILPKAFDNRVGAHVASCVAKAAIESGVAQLSIDPDKIKEKMLNK